MNMSNSSAPIENECHSDRREESLFTSGLGRISRCARKDKEPELLRI